MILFFKVLPVLFKNWSYSTEYGLEFRNPLLTINIWTPISEQFWRMKDFNKNSFWLKFNKKYNIPEILVHWYVNLISTKINNSNFKNKVTRYDFWTWTSFSSIPDPPCMVKEIYCCFSVSKKKMFMLPLIDL